MGVSRACLIGPQAAGALARAPGAGGGEARLTLDDGGGLGRRGHEVDEHDGARDGRPGGIGAPDLRAGEGRPGTETGVADRSVPAAGRIGRSGGATGRCGGARRAPRRSGVTALTSRTVSSPASSASSDAGTVPTSSRGSAAASAAARLRSRSTMARPMNEEAALIKTRISARACRAWASECGWRGRRSLPQTAGRGSCQSGAACERPSRARTRRGAVPDQGGLTGHQSDPDRYGHDEWQRRRGRVGGL